MLLSGPNDCLYKNAPSATSGNLEKLLQWASKWHVDLNLFENAMYSTEKSTEVYNAYNKELSALNHKYWTQIAQLPNADKETLSKVLATEPKFKKYMDAADAFSKIKIGDVVVDGVKIDVK